MVFLYNIFQFTFGYGLFLPLASMILLPALPSSLAWRVGALCILLLAGYFNLERSYFDPGIESIMGSVMIIGSCGIGVALACGRFVFLKTTNRDDYAVWPKLLGFMDLLVAGVGAAILSALIFKVAAVGFSGTSSAALTHVSFFALNGLAVALPLVLRWPAAVITGGTAAALVTATLLFVSLQHPKAVVGSAIRVADGRPACMHLNHRRAEPERWQQLTLLTMDKAAGAHAFLVIETQAGFTLYDWSYYDGQFAEPFDRERQSYCTPRADFAASPYRS